MATGAIINVSVLPFCDLVVISTVGAFCILINYALSISLLGEKIVWVYDLPAVILMIGGCLMVILLSDYSEKTYTPDRITDLLFSAVSLICFIITGMILAGTIFQYCWHLKQLKNFNDKVNIFMMKKVQELQGPQTDPRTTEQLNKILDECGHSIDEACTKERPQRLLIKVIQGFPTQIIADVCAQTAKVFKPMIKMPMVTILTVCGIGTSLNMCCFTFLGELLQSGTFLDAPGLIVFLVIYAFVGSVGLLFTVNFVNSIYDQVDTVPVYQSTSMIFSVVAGLTLLGEGSEYSTGHIVGIFIGIMIAIGGIFILSMKQTAVKEDDKNAGLLSRLERSAEDQQAAQDSDEAETLCIPAEDKKILLFLKVLLQKPKVEGVIEASSDNKAVDDADEEITNDSVLLNKRSGSSEKVYSIQ